jgi:hypothetical protein
MNDPILLASLLLTAFCGIGTIGVAILSVILPDASMAPLMGQTFRLFAFVFSIGAGAILFKALG